MLFEKYNSDDEEEEEEEESIEHGDEENDKPKINIKGE